MDLRILGFPPEKSDNNLLINDFFLQILTSL